MKISRILLIFIILPLIVVIGCRIYNTLSQTAMLPVQAQTGGNYDLSWNTVGGGGSLSSGDIYSVVGTIGQHDANSMAGGNYELFGGFFGGGSFPGNHPPTDIQLSNNTVLEEQPLGTSVGVLSTTDQDAGDTFTYSFISGEGDSGNHAFSISGDQVLTAEIFNYDIQDTYSIRISSEDQDGLSCEVVFSIYILEKTGDGYQIFLPMILR